MKALLSAWLGLVLAPTLFAVDPPPKLSVDLTGNGMSQTYTVELSRSNPDSDFESAVLKAGKESIPLGKDFTGFTVAWRLTVSRGINRPRSWKSRPRGTATTLFATSSPW
ncbi:hypothetical protein [Verrucomicrobium spinosum]|uniref:hypothetical protein n=1 Tax=Verrucomicrobium spinosum TaxID=2736 RepID=UPI000946715B|nr:hypothetical protein [Verrucomicrobium spinosum]